MVKVTILVENTVPLSDLTGEHGFAALLETDDKKILFDVGNRGTLFENCRALKVDLHDIDAVVFSHGHYDHTGAVLALLEDIGPKKIYAHSNIFAHRVIPLGDGKFMEPGCPFSRQQIEAAGGELILIDDFQEIYPGIFFSGEIPRINDYEDVGGRGKFKVLVNNELVDDTLPDDIALIIDHPEGLIVISGCAHSGVVNIIDYAVKKTGKSKILAFIGGTHLLDAAQERLDRTVEALAEFDIEKMAVCHCTGFHAEAFLYHKLPGFVVKGEVGSVFLFK